MAFFHDICAAAHERWSMVNAGVREKMSIMKRSPIRNKIGAYIKGCNEIWGALPAVVYESDEL